jgi:primosomal protein N' (replication factor Y)
MFADVIVPRHLTKTFTYLVPPLLLTRVGVGQRVVVPFGRTTLEGAVVGLTRDLPGGVIASQLKAITSVSDGNGLSGFSPGMFELSRQVAEEYIAPWGQCLRLVAPPARAVAQPKWCYVVTSQGRLALEQGRCPDMHLPLLQRIARRKKGLSTSTIQSSRRSSEREALLFLEAQQWILRNEGAVSNRPSRIRGSEAGSELSTPVCVPIAPAVEVMQRLRCLCRLAPQQGADRGSWTIESVSWQACPICSGERAVRSHYHW